MARYWVFSVTMESYEISVRESLVAVGKRFKKLLDQVEIGDLITFYISKNSYREDAPDGDKKVQAFCGAAEVTGPIEESNKVIWPPKNGDTFPWRRKILFQISEGKVPVRSLFGQLSFITNTLTWGLAFQGACREITEDDFNLIRKELKFRYSVFMLSDEE